MSAVFCRLTAFFLLAVVLLFAAPSEAQVFVYPRRPDKSLVRHFDFKDRKSVV